MATLKQQKQQRKQARARQREEVHSQAGSSDIVFKEDPGTDYLQQVGPSVIEFMTTSPDQEAAMLSYFRRPRTRRLLREWPALKIWNALQLSALESDGQAKMDESVTYETPVPGLRVYPIDQFRRRCSKCSKVECDWKAALAGLGETKLDAQDNYSVLRRHMQDKLNESTILMQCALCAAAGRAEDGLYCSTACQQSDWFQHKSTVHGPDRVVPGKPG